MRQHRRKRHLPKDEICFTENMCGNLDKVLAKNIANGLKVFINMDRDGVPASYVKHPDDPQPGDFEQEKKEWEEDLKKMLWAFQEVANEFLSSPHWIWFCKESDKLVDKGIDPFYWVKKEDGTAEQKDNLPEEPEDVKEKEEAYRKKIQEGLHLFADHLEGLWN